MSDGKRSWEALASPKKGVAAGSVRRLVQAGQKQARISIRGTSGRTHLAATSKGTNIPPSVPTSSSRKRP